MWPETLAQFPPSTQVELPPKKTLDTVDPRRKHPPAVNSSSDGLECGEHFAVMTCTVEKPSPEVVEGSGHVVATSDEARPDEPHSNYQYMYT